MRVVQSKWSLENEGWSVEYPEECVALCPLENDAALQISCANKTAGPVLESDISEMVEETRSGHGGESIPVRCGQFEGAVLEYVDGKRFWRRWWLSNGGTLVFVTYNTSTRKKERDRAQVDRILSTLAAPGEHAM
jgi:hypothetical protein